ncbi:hypothetical protein SK128_015785 [Halocaridina rubra]|uniref:Uncharacterized protein n=1 Tax=Halocaridina rubra TaxID=373956 RepID=A0AAN8WKH6_HALRR
MFSRHVIIILFINALSVLVKASYVSINAFGGADQILGDFTYGELGRLKPVISPEEKELEDICNCLQGNGYCIHKLQNYGPIVRQGTCYGNLSTRNKRKAKRSDVAFSSPPTFIENKKCRGTKTIILASSGMERQLTLTTPASVFICNGSIEASLQQLFITGVNKIVIAPGALKHRVTDLEIRFSSLEDKIIIPEEGLAIQITVDDQSMDNPGIEIDQTPLLPPKIRLEVDTANDIEFRSRSLVAPIVHLKLNQVKKVSFDSNSIIPYAYPEASTLEIGHCHSVTMDTQTINTGKYEAKNIKHLFMKEKAVEVVGKDGSVAKIEYVSNITLLDEALSIGSGADILLNNLTFTSAGVRAIQGNGPGYLRRAAFTYVAGKQFESVAMCIKAETAVVYNVEIRGNNDSIVGACIEGQVIHKDDKPGETVGCLKVEGSPLLCNNSACAPCGPEPNGT